MLQSAIFSPYQFCYFCRMEKIRLSQHYKETVRVGLPIIIGQLGVITLGFADTMMVGHYSTPALAAASFVNNIFVLVSILLMGFSYGITPLVGALFSQREYLKVGATVKNALAANCIYGALIILVMTVLYFFLDRFGQPEELLPLIRPYYVVILVSMAFVVLFNVFRQFTDAIMLTPIAMWVLIGGNVFNIIFNYFLIYGKCGFPEMGLLGAGISTMSSRIVMAIVFGWLLLRQVRFSAYRKGFFSADCGRREIRRVFKISFPVSLQMGMETGTFTVSAIMVGWIGTVQLASYQVMVTLSTLGFMFYYGIGAAMAIRIASYVGLGDELNVRRAAFAGHHILLIIATLSSLVFLLFAKPLIGFFSSDTNVVAACVALIPALILYQFGDATQIGYSNALRGISRVVPVMWIALFSFIVVGIPAAYLLGFPLGLGEVGIFYSFSISLFTAAILYLWQFVKSTRTVEREPA